MPDQKISQLTSATTPLAGTEVLPIVQSGATKQVSVANLTAGRSVDMSTLTVTGDTYLATTSGNVGIGNTSPAYKLHITGTLGVSGLAEFADGLAASPSITNIGDTNTGLYFPSADAIAIVTGGVNRLRVTSAGDVGIGTITPGAKLETSASSSGATLEMLRLSNIGTGANTKARLNFYAASTNYGAITSGYGASSPEMIFDINTSSGPFIWNSNTTERMRLDSAGNLGIGTSSPSSYVTGASGGLAQRISGGATILNVVSGDASSTSNVGMYSGASSADNPAIFYQANLRFATVTSSAGVTGFSEKMRITSTGDVGIGTSSPGYKLTVAGTSGTAVVSLLETGVRSWGVRAGGSSTNTFDIADFTAGASRLLIDASGNVGIGTTSPDQRLHVADSGQTYAAIKFSNSTASAGIISYSTDNFLFYTNNTERMRIDSSGNVGIGTSSPAYKVDVSVSTNGVNGYNAYGDNGGTAEQIGYRALNANSTGLFAGVNGFNYSGTVGNANNGVLYTIGNVSMVFGINSTERMRLDTSGNLGIGTSSPSAKLDVVGKVNANSAVSGDVIANFVNTDVAGYGLRTVGGASGGGYALSVNNYASGELMRVDGNGNVGIGTSSPGYKLDVYKAGAASISAARSDTQAVLRAEVGSVAVDLNTAGSVGEVRTATNHALVFSTNATERMRIDTSGNVGIGTSSPSYKLDVVGYGRFSSGLVGSGGLLMYGDSSSSSGLLLTTSGNLGLGVTPSAWGASTKSFSLAASGAAFVSARTDAFRLNVGLNAYDTGSDNWTYAVSLAASRYSQIDGAHNWFTAPSGTAGNAISFTQAMTLDASGNLLVGTTTALLPAAGRGNITLNGSSNAVLAFGIGGVSSGYVYSSSTNLEFDAAGSRYIQFNTNGNERLRIDSSGNVGIGVATPGSKLHVTVANSGTFQTAANFTNDANADFQVSVRTNETRVGPSPAIPLIFANNGGTERLRITSTGNVHTPAGTTTMTDGFIYIPAAAGAPTGAATAITGTVPLYYNSSSNTLYAYNSSWQTVSGGLSLLSTNANGVVYLNGSSQATTSTALVFNGTEFGVGQSPSAGIQIDVTTTSLAQIRARATTNAVDSRLAASSTGLLGYTGTISNHDFAVYTNNTERLRLATDGTFTVTNTGGLNYFQNSTTTGSSLLSVLTGVGYATVLRQYGSAATGTTDGVSNAGLAILEFNGSAGLIRQQGAFPISFATNGSERMRLTSGGLLGIGTSSPGGVGVHVNSNTGGAYYYATGTVSGNTVSFLAYNASSGVDATASYGLWNNNGVAGPVASIAFYSTSASHTNAAASELRIANGANAPITFYANNVEKFGITPDAGLIIPQPAQSAQNTSATLTIAQIKTGIITANAAVTLTLPTAANLNTYVTGMAVDTAFEVVFIATTASAITIGANGNTTVGSLTVAGNTSGRYRFRKTATTPTFTVYRV